MRYWIIAPMEVNAPNNLFATAWEYDKQHGTIAVGRFGSSLTLPDALQFADADEFQTEIEKHELNWKSSDLNIIWNFHRNIQEGDTVIARRGFKEILGIGMVTKTAHYDFAKGIERIKAEELKKEFQSYVKPCFIEIFWIITGNFSVKLKLKPNNRLLHEINGSQYQKLLMEAFTEKPNLNVPETLKVEIETDHQEFQLERDLIWTQRPKSRSSQNPNYYIGIDLGTTNSVMAWGAVNPQTKHFEPKIVPINMRTEYYAMEKKDLLPSYIYFEKGQPPSVGEYAKKMLEEQPDQVAESIKHQLGTQNEFEIDGNFYTPSQFLAIILKYLAASANSHFGFIPDNAVITVPAYFNTKMRAATIEAVGLTGFRTTDDNGDPRVILLDEPYAVLYDRINQEIRGETDPHLTKSHNPKLVLIFDLGGGALEVSLHRVSYQKDQNIPKIEPIARSYNTQIGGKNFDELLAVYFYNSYVNQLLKLLSDLFKEHVDKLPLNLLSHSHELLLIHTFEKYAEYAKRVKGEFPINPDDFQKFSLNAFRKFNDLQKSWIKNAFRQYTEQAKSEFPVNADNFQKSLIKNAFRQYAEQAKIKLSEQIAFAKSEGTWDPEAHPDTFTIPTIIRKPFWDKEFRYERFSLEKYEQIVEPFLASHLTLDAVNQFDTIDIEKNNIIYPILDVLRKGRDRIGTFPRVDVVLLNGSMTKFHTIQKRLETLFGFAPLQTNDDGAVARGAAVFHYNLEQRGFKPLPRILMETIKIEIAAKKPRHYVESRTQIPFHRRFSIKAGTHLPTVPSKFFDLAVEVGEISARLTIVYRSSPNSLNQFQTQVQEFQFGRPLKKEDIPISVRMSISRQGTLDVEGHPKNNPDEKFTATVNLEAPIQENSTQFNAVGLRPLNTGSEIEELTTNFKQLALTNNFDTRRRILSRIEAQESRIVQSANAEKFVAPLCEVVDSLDNLGKMLAINILGNLATVCSDTDLLHDICEVALKLISSKEIKTNGRTYVNSVVRHTVETIGKTGLSIAKSSLFRLLHSNKTNDIRPVVIHSIGKCCDSIDAVEHLKPFIGHSMGANRIAANWALGRIGSREKENSLLIQQFIPFITNFMEQLEMDGHEDIQRNSIYALAEICDRRRSTSDPIESKTAAKVVLLLVTFLINQTRANLSDSTLSESGTKLQKAALLAIQMIRGIDLSPDEEESLRAIREEN